MAWSFDKTACPIGEVVIFGFPDNTLSESGMIGSDGIASFMTDSGDIDFDPQPIAWQHMPAPPGAN